MITDILNELNNIWRSMTPPWRTQFRPPADSAAIDRAEEAIGHAFPTDLREVLLWADGQIDSFLEVFPEPIFPSIRVDRVNCRSEACWLTSVDRIVSRHNYFLEPARNFHTKDFLIHGPAYPHSELIWFTFSEGTACLVLDLSPPPGGNFGQVLHHCVGPYEIAVLAPNLGTFLGDILTGIRNDRFVVRKHSLSVEDQMRLYLTESSSYFARDEYLFRDLSEE